MDRDRLLQTIAVLFGGRIAEEVFMNQMTTGASNDFAVPLTSRAPDGDAVGHVRHARTDGVWRGGGRDLPRPPITTHRTCPRRRCRRSTRDPPHHRSAVPLARRLLEENSDKVEAMTAALLEWGDHRRRAGE